jgi:uncharacterized protein YlaN (UPF0358 family)
MSNDIFASKIELLQEQIENLEKSGFFTEKEIDTKCYPLREELKALKRQLVIAKVDRSGADYGLTPEQMQEGRRVFNTIWKQLDDLTNPTCNIEVNDAEIVTINTISE